MKWHIKLSGEKIMGHQDDRHGYYSEDGSWVYKFDPKDYDAVVSADRLIGDDKNYKYKYVNGELVKMTKEEIEKHPLVKRKKISAKIEKLKLKEKEKLVYKDIKKAHELTEEEIAYIDEILAKLEN